MSDSSLLLNSLSHFLLAFLVALGCVALIQKFVADRVLRLHAVQVEIVPGGGVALVAGIAISSFYLFQQPPESTTSLIIAVAAAVILSGTSKAIAARTSVDPMLLVIYRLIGMLAIVIGLLMPHALQSHASVLPTWLVIGMFTLLPIAMVRSGHLTEQFAPRRTSLLFLMMLVGVLLVASHSDFQHADFDTRANWTITVPILGALTAVLIHMTDWRRRQHDTVLGEGGNLALGLALSWMSLQLAAQAPRPGVTIVSLSLIVCSPLYAAAARAIFDRMRPPVDLQEQPVEVAVVRSHARFEYGATAALIALGLVVTWSGMHWALGLGVLMLSFFGYLYGLAATNCRIPVASASPQRASVRAVLAQRSAGD